MQRNEGSQVISTACFDIETSDLDGARGIILCACIQSSKQRKMVTLRTDKMNPNWKKGLRGDDSALVKELSDILVEHDVLAAHNGAKFDIPFVRTRRLRWGMKPMPEKKMVDPLAIAWRKLRLRSNRLGAISDHLGIADKKTPLDLSIWMDCILNGTKASMDLIVEHCQADVRVLEAVLEAVQPYVKILDERGSAL